MNLARVLRLLSVLVCLVAVVVLIVDDDLPDVSWVFGGLFAALGLYVASAVVEEFPRRTP